jgi:hypothetical protein
MPWMKIYELKNIAKIEKPRENCKDWTYLSD